MNRHSAARPVLNKTAVALSLTLLFAAQVPFYGWSAEAAHRLTGPQWQQLLPFRYAGKGRFKLSLTSDGRPLPLAVVSGSGDAQRLCAPGAPLALGQPQPLSRCGADVSSELAVAAGDYQLLLEQGANGQWQLAVTAVSDGRALPAVDCPRWDGAPLWVDVSSQFADGTALREAYSGQRVVVKQGRVQLAPAPGSEGLLLLERDIGGSPTFSWDNAIVYFAMTDRFRNGNPDNDLSYGRRRDGVDPIGTFHGGDLRGVIDALDYLDRLGVNAIWLTPLFEQVHGFVGGEGQGSYPFYGYHGYWPLDFTRIDANFGTPADLHELVAKAHARGIRVVMDVILNHVGYATLADLQDFDIPVVKTDALPSRWSDWSPQPGESWHSYNRYVDYRSPLWAQRWFSPEWVRAGLEGYPRGGGDDISMQLAGLPDLRTEQTSAVGLPPLLANKDDTGAKPLADGRVVDYLIQWQTEWLRQYGIDGVRADTVKHVEKQAWRQFRDAAEQARRDWVKANPQDPTAATPLWMVGEVWQQGTWGDDYPQYGFDALINFDYQNDHALPLALCPASAEGVYQRYQQGLDDQPGYQPLSYISSHDTRLFYAGYGDDQLQRRAANTLLLLPGAVQITYGDESGREAGPWREDFAISTRSDMNWTATAGTKASLVDHWSRLAQFRKRHPAIASGHHQQLPSSAYAFARSLTAAEGTADQVVVVFAGNSSR